MIVNKEYNGTRMIREYEGKTGNAYVLKYEDEYRVVHSNDLLQIESYWTRNLPDAVMHAQFIARY